MAKATTPDSRWPRVNQMSMVTDTIGDQHVKQQFVAFLLGRFTVVAGYGDVDVVRDDVALEGRHPLRAPCRPR